MLIAKFALVIAMALIVYAPGFPDWMTGRPSANVRLSVAISTNDLPEFAAAMEDGASPSECSEGGTLPLTDAARFGQLAMMRQLIAAGADIDAVEADGITPLMAAAAEDRVEAVELLICCGAKVSCRDRALDWANGSGCTRAARVLRRAERQSPDSNAIARGFDADCE
jgi:hypothetical protein